jgi:hypothetical protein
LVDVAVGGGITLHAANGIRASHNGDYSGAATICQRWIAHDASAGMEQAQGAQVPKQNRSRFNRA